VLRTLRLNRLQGGQAGGVSRAMQQDVRRRLWFRQLGG
jgi:hypothetical protein